jgi:hypothetical protein
MTLRMWLRLVNQCCDRHSSRKRLLMLSMSAFWTPEGSRGRERQAEAAAGQLDARIRRDARGAAPKIVAVAARREVVRQLQGLGLSERRALKLVGMSASTLRYEPRDDGNEGLGERLKELAGQHRLHGYRMLHNRLRSTAGRSTSSAPTGSTARKP